MLIGVYYKVDIEGDNSSIRGSNKVKERKTKADNEEEKKDPYYDELRGPHHPKGHFCYSIKGGFQRRRVESVMVYRKHQTMLCRTLSTNPTRSSKRQQVETNLLSPLDQLITYPS